MRRRTYLGGLLTGGLTALAGCAAAGDGVGDVDMSKNAYLPQSIEITVGETVTWVNNSSRGHCYPGRCSLLGLGRVRE